MATEWTDEAERDVPFAVILQLMGGSRPRDIWTQVASHLKTWGHDVGSASEIRKHWIEVTWERLFVEPKRQKVKAAASDPAAQKLPIPDWYCDAFLSDMSMEFGSVWDTDSDDSECDFGGKSSASKCDENTSVTAGTTSLPIRTRPPTTSTINVDGFVSAAIKEKLLGRKRD